jgi:hypothetical protein
MNLIKSGLLLSLVRLGIAEISCDSLTTDASGHNRTWRIEKLTQTATANLEHVNIDFTLDSPFDDNVMLDCHSDSTDDYGYYIGSCKYPATGSLSNVTTNFNYYLNPDYIGSTQIRIWQDFLCRSSDARFERGYGHPISLIFVYRKLTSVFRIDAHIETDLLYNKIFDLSCDTKSSNETSTCILPAPITICQVATETHPWEPQKNCTTPSLNPSWILEQFSIDSMDLVMPSPSGAVHAPPNITGWGLIVFKIFMPNLDVDLDKCFGSWTKYNDSRIDDWYPCKYDHITTVPDPHIPDVYFRVEDLSTWEISLQQTWTCDDAGSGP